ncbi:collagen alpha-1(III) chain-like [Phyllostomus hastatus]|uniref:collagen alpha-1(III) chain-like n=1 Tax=Phyllostomus hastatus TaxID=9423 RepID=UPI001E684327|nr:collagen alpha-1(III) chain-like [Phyllostomus hastatus]
MEVPALEQRGERQREQNSPHVRLRATGPPGRTEPRSPPSGAGRTIPNRPAPLHPRTPAPLHPCTGPRHGPGALGRCPPAHTAGLPLPPGRHVLESLGRDAPHQQPWHRDSGSRRTVGARGDPEGLDPGSTGNCGPSAQVTLLHPFLSPRAAFSRVGPSPSPAREFPCRRNLSTNLSLQLCSGSQAPNVPLSPGRSGQACGRRVSPTGGQEEAAQPEADTQDPTVPAWAGNLSRGEVTVGPPGIQQGRGGAADHGSDAQSRGLAGGLVPRSAARGRPPTSLPRSPAGPHPPRAPGPGVDQKPPSGARADTVDVEGGQRAGPTAHRCARKPQEQAQPGCGLRPRGHRDSAAAALTTPRAPASSARPEVNRIKAGTHSRVELDRRAAVAGAQWSSHRQVRGLDLTPSQRPCRRPDGPGSQGAPDLNPLHRLPAATPLVRREKAQAGRQPHEGPRWAHGNVLCIRGAIGQSPRVGEQEQSAGGQADGSPAQTARKGVAGMRLEDPRQSGVPGTRVGAQGHDTHGSCFGGAPSPEPTASHRSSPPDSRNQDRPQSQPGSLLQDLHPTSPPPTATDFHPQHGSRSHQRAAAPPALPPRLVRGSRRQGRAEQRPGVTEPRRHDQPPRDAHASTAHMASGPLGGPGAPTPPPAPAQASPHRGLPAPHRPSPPSTPRRPPPAWPGSGAAAGLLECAGLPPRPLRPPGPLAADPQPSTVLAAGPAVPGAQVEGSSHSREVRAPAAHSQGALGVPWAPHHFGAEPLPPPPTDRELIEGRNRGDSQLTARVWPQEGAQGRSVVGTPHCGEEPLPQGCPSMSLGDKLEGRRLGRQ